MEHCRNLGACRLFGARQQRAIDSRRSVSGYERLASGYPLIGHLSRRRHRDVQDGLAIPNFCILDWRVVRFMPSLVAAP